jgi:glycosyltransferase involved in cell wall biosynthesis
MARWKGHEVFLRALSMLPAETPVRGYIVGGPIYQTDYSQHSIEDLRLMAEGLGVATRVGFTGFIDDVASAMRSLDVVVHASTQPEPFGLVIAEAMACGKAIVISEGGGAAEIVSIGTDALSHPPGDAASLARCIEKLATDPMLRSNLGKAARSAAERRFDRERLAAELVAIYQALAPSSN